MEVQDFADPILQIDDLIYVDIELAFGIDHEVMQLYMSPSTGKRDGVVHTALATVVNDLICRKLLPKFSYVDFWDYLKKTKRYRPLEPEEAKAL